MKQDSKYYPLYEYLRESQRSEITLTIDEIEARIEGNLTESARTRKAWWSNREKGALQAQAWISAGYQTRAIDLQAQTVTIRKVQTTYNVQRQDGQIVWDNEAIRALRQHLGLTQAELAEELGVRRQTISEWENGVYEPDRSTAKHLGLVAERAVFRYGQPRDDQFPSEGG
jgi:DNA-binding XRE family transcriptional regulator